MTKTNETLLSICIPTYNGREFIKEALESILFENNSEVEIIVVDDKSTDDTFGIATQFKKEHPAYKIRVIRNKRNLGFDKNVLEVVSQAKGRFCWLLGQDDKLLPGSIKIILKEIRKHPKVALIYCNYKRYDHLLKKVTSEAMVSIKRKMTFANYNKFFFHRVYKSYFQYLGTNVITMSTNIVNKDLWEKATPFCLKGVGHNFIHCFVIAKMTKESPKIVYLGKPQLIYRSNNHRVWPNDIWKDYNRVFIDFLIEEGYNRKKALEMRRSQRKYEKRESAIKQPFLKHIYKYARPIIGLARMARSRFSIK